MLTGYLAPEGHEDSLQEELSPIVARHGRLFLAEGPPQKVHWVQNIWFDAKIIPIQSISQAATELRALNGLWAYYPHAEVRRGELIASKLPFFSPKPLPFPANIPTAPLGSWTLLDEYTLLASAKSSSPFAHGEYHFKETKTPPSRAYLKLWELFTRTGQMPKRGERCLEVGASPGSWTWVLQQLGAEVIAVDRAELAPAIARLPGIRFLKQDAFSLTPHDFPKLDWVFCDVVCYPEKLRQWLELWLTAGVNLVCTVKFQGKGDYGVLREFESIEGSQLIHLFHNKHELTLYRTGQVPNI